MVDRHLYSMKEKKAKRLHMEVDDKSITSPLIDEKKDKRGIMESEGRKINVVNLISSSHEDTDQIGGNEKCDEWNPNVLELRQKVIKLESKVDKLEGEVNYLKKMLNNLILSGAAYETPKRLKPLSTPRKSNVTDINTSKAPKRGDKGEPSAKRRVFVSPSQKNKTHDKPLVVTSTPTGCYIMPRTTKGTSSKQVGQTSSKQAGWFIPGWLFLMFKPIKTMNLTYEECAVASYIFGPKNIDGNDVIVTTEFCQGTRKLLQCLKPRQMLEEDTINLTVSMLTYKERSDGLVPGLWFLPTTFAQLALSGNTTTEVMIAYYQDMFMGQVEYIEKIFIPMYDAVSMHWFLLVIDLLKKELIHLDSFPSSAAAIDRRMTSVFQLARYMDDLIMDSSFYEFRTTNKPEIYKFNLVIPDGLGMQADYSNDCGIWVITWMMQMRANGYEINVDDGTRLRIALNLTMNPYNKLKDEVLLKSLQQIEGLDKA